MQKSNINPCPHKGDHKHTIRTSDGRTALLCDDCLAAMESRLADPLLIRGMLKAVMTGQEVARMRNERENMRVEKDLQDTIAAAHAVAGFPRCLALPAPMVM